MGSIVIEDMFDEIGVAGIEGEVWAIGGVTEESKGEGVCDVDVELVDIDTSDFIQPQLESHVEFSPICLHWSYQWVLHSQGQVSTQEFLSSYVG